MHGMFYGCRSLTSLDVTNFNTTNVEDMSFMFWECWGLTSLDITNFNTENVTNMGRMFAGCSGLTTLDVSSFNTANVTDMTYMFSGCTGLTSLNISNFNTEKVKRVSYMFNACNNLATIQTPETMGTTALPLPVRFWNGTDYIYSIASTDANKTIYRHDGHTFGQWQEEVPATCTTAGTKGYQDCTICGNHYESNGVTKISNLTINALGHDIIHYNAKDPTCTEIGWNEHNGCSRCDYATDKVEIDALGHAYEEEFTIDLEPTCTTAGSKSKHCSRCDDKTEITEIAALGHDYEEEYTIDKEPTIFSKGSKSKHCSRCDDADVVAIPALLSTGAIIGIGIGILIILLLIILLIILLLKNKEKNKQNKKTLIANEPALKDKDNKMLKSKNQDKPEISVTKLEFKNAFKNLPADQKEYFNTLKDYALQQPQAQLKPTKYHLSIGIGNSAYVKFVIKYNTLIACFDTMEIKVVNASSVETTKQMIDKYVAQIQSAK